MKKVVMLVILGVLSGCAQYRPVSSNAGSFDAARVRCNSEAQQEYSRVYASVQCQQLNVPCTDWRNPACTYGTANMPYQDCIRHQKTQATNAQYAAYESCMARSGWIRE